MVKYSLNMSLPVRNVVCRTIFTNYFPGIAGAIGAGAVGGFSGSAVGQYIDGGSVDMVEAGKSAAWGGATAWLPWKMLGYNGRGATGKLGVFVFC